MGSVLDVPTIPWRPGLFGGLTVRSIRLPEYDGDYRVLDVAPDAPLATLLGIAPVVRIPVPGDVASREPVLHEVATRVTKTVHSQPPHVDHPHRNGDPRRWNLFWASAPRAAAATYFLPRSTEIVARLTAFVRANPAVWEASRRLVERYRIDPRSLSRYPVPPEAVAAWEALVREGDGAGWERMTDYGRTTIATRILGNDPIATACVEAILPGLACFVERWDEPCVVIADDTDGFHGRWGVGESGGAFRRMWIAGEAPSRGALRWFP